MEFKTDESFTVEFGQYEPLTGRLHNLLKEYKDGFSVPKELIQNAEDAGATEVCFLYDERVNIKDKSQLLNDGLREFQGPALWAYNNKPFTKNDLENIRKLGGVSKAEDATKVGKFGLGFNSVYNLTDLPSFVTGNQAVIFDPHTTHLGKPGLSTDLKREKDSEIIKKWGNQLKPYEGIFGCKLDFQGTISDGVLFRFPLRTKQQALKSKIKDLSYSKQEMRNFFTVFAKYAGSLILFTQNVQSVTFYHLPESRRPGDMIKLVEVTKSMVYKQLVFDDCSQDASHINILEYSSEALGNESVCDELQCIEEQNKIQVTFAKQTYNAACKIEPMTNQTMWQVTWSVGDNEAQMFARMSPLRGLLPLSAVAIPLKTASTGICTVSDCGNGFYDSGHLFCFMPLPIATKHKIHINATFALTSDRRQLCIKSTDDIESGEADWNRILDTHVIGQAWAYALQNLSHTGMVDERIFYELWPDVSHFSEREGILKSFCTLIIDRDLKIFCHEKGKKWSSYSEIWLLDPKLRNNETVGVIALSALDKMKRCVIDLPNVILQNFHECGFQDEINSRTVAEDDFFIEIFFPNISNRFITEEERNKLISYALLSSSETLQQIVKENQCIPTKPKGKLKMPSELVSPRGQSAGLFLEEDVFPDRFFCDDPMLKALENLGMTVDELSSKNIVERATLIKERKDVNLVRNFLRYLSSRSMSNSSNRRFEAYLDVQKVLQTTKILPVLKKPKDWPFEWRGGSGSFAAPMDLYQRELIDIVGCCENILDISILEITATDILKWLGVKGRLDIPPLKAMNQLKCLSSRKKDTSHTSMRKLSAVCHSVYMYLEDCCKLVQQNQRETNDSKLIEDALYTCPVILSANRLIEPQKMALNLMLPLKPYLFEVDEEIHQWYPLFLKTVGVRDTFEHRDILNVMSTIELGAFGGPLLAENLECFCRAVSVLVDAIKREGSEVPEVKLPSTDGHLYPASVLCLNDCGWISDQNDMLFLHPNISPSDGYSLGVRTKREINIAVHIEPIPQTEGFGQCEPLTSRIRRILQSYPRDVAILKELLQNADDAGATELMFIKDFRFHETKKVFGEEWIQGPALCVFNNSHFKEDDFIRIQSLGEGSKAQDPLKTGRYGVGFNVVYHLTDVPSFMTVGPGIEKTLCVLDPHKRYTPKTVVDTPGIQFKDLNVLRETYNDVFSCYFEDSVMNVEEGTLFRFPLRNDDMADKSKISQNTTTITDIETMLEVFKDEALPSILFLSSVKKISICTVLSNGKLVTEHTVEASLQNKTDEKNLQMYVSKLKHDIAQCDPESIEPLQMQIIKTIKDSRNEKQDWLIVHRVGFDRSVSFPDDLKFCTNQQIKLLPRGGVALPLNQTQNVTSRLFCMLPLPIETGLPIHINGQFILGHEARRDLWQGTNDYRVHWNEHITKAVICPAYIAAVKRLRMLYFPEDETHCYFEAAISKYYKLFPHMERTTNMYTQLLVKSFYTAVAANHIPLFPVLQPRTGTFLKHSNKTGMRVEWVPVVTDAGFPGYFNTFNHFLTDKQLFTPMVTQMSGEEKWNVSEETPAQRDRRNLACILKDLGMKIIESCTDIQPQFDKTDFKDAVKGTSPDVVILFLKSSTETNGCLIEGLPQLLSNTPLQSVENVKLLTNFCQMTEMFEENMVNLPLMVTQSKMLHFLTEETQYIVTTYTDLLSKSADKLLHESLVSLYEKLNLTKTKCLKFMNITDLSQLLEDNLDQSIFKTGQPISWSEEPSQLWMCRLWEFLSAQVSYQFTYRRGDDTNVKEKDFAVALLSPLRKWSLMPAFITQTDHESNLIKLPRLYPVEASRYIISFDYRLISEFAKVLMKVHLPKLMSSTFIVKNIGFFSQSQYLCSLIVANVKEPKTMLEAMSQTSGRDSLLSDTECCNVLHYFDKNMNILESSIPNLSQKLKMLSYFPSLSGIPVAINDYAQVHVVKDNHPFIPKGGLEYLFSRLTRTLIIHKYYYETILSYLNLPNLSREKAYTDIIIPKLMTFTPEVRMKHLLHIRDNIILQMWNFNHKRKDLKLINKLADIPFILTRDSQCHKVSEFYSIKVAEFKAMCPPNAFLPPPFDEDEWQPLLELIGLKCQISVKDFVQFAVNLERNSGRNITDEVLTNSQILVQHLQKRHRLIKDGLLMKIRHIRFVLPYDIVKEKHDGCNLISIHPQYENARKLVSYSQSSNPCFYRSIWTCRSMLAKDADICRHLTPKDAEYARVQLGMPFEPPVEVLIEHCENVCNSINRKDALFKHQQRSLLRKLFSDMYQQLQKHEQNTVMCHRLMSVPTIYLDEQQVIVPAEDIVIDLSSSEAIRGYIFRAPTNFRNFFSLFEALGAQNIVTANTYVTVLQKLFMKTRGKRLNPNELKIVSIALSNLIDCLSKTEKASIKIEPLYLPNTECVLTDATSLVYVDDEDLLRRLASLPLTYFIGFEVLELQGYGMPKFPKKYALMPLSELLTETLSQFCLEKVDNSGRAYHYEQKIRSSTFIKGILRICNHTSADFSENDAKKIKGRLDMINIRQVEGLETVLIYKGTVVGGSEFTRDCYLMAGSSHQTEEMTDQCVTVYLNSISTEECRILFTIASAINSLVYDRLGRFTSAVEKMLAAEPEGIDQILDACLVKSYAQVNKSSLLTVYQSAGSPISKEFYYMLDNSFTQFDEGEYVGLDEAKAGQSVPVYVYAIIVKREYDIPQTTATYHIEVAGKMTKIVSATKLYKFNREKTKA